MIAKEQMESAEPQATVFGERPAIGKQTFNRFCELIYQKAGIMLGPHKEALVCARVGRRMRHLGLTDFHEYYKCVRNDESGQELVELLNAISTNVTHFFREKRHFDLLGSLLKQWEAAGQTKFRIWCAAASTGQEPYSIGITMKENLKDTRDALVLATDLSTRALGAARKAIYEDSLMDAVPEFMVDRYFSKVKGQRPTAYAVNENVRKMVRFARINLAQPPFPLKGPLDAVFCRNVMIYFDNAVRKRLLDDLYRLIKPGGYLMVGHAESLSGMLSSFKSVEPSVYVKK